MAKGAGKATVSPRAQTRQENWPAGGDPGLSHMKRGSRGSPTCKENRTLSRARVCQLEFS